MAGAWGKSWGGAFGVAFGAVALAAVPTLQGTSGGGIFTDPTVTTLFASAHSDDDLQQQIRQEDEALMVVIAQFMINGAFA